jgi:cyanate permease
MSACGLAVTLIPSLPAVVAGLGLLAAGIFIVQALATSFLGVAVTHGKSAAVGIYVTVYYIGGSLGAVLPSPIWHRFGWPGCVGLIIAVELVMLGFASWSWRERPHRVLLSDMPKIG